MNRRALVLAALCTLVAPIAHAEDAVAPLDKRITVDLAGADAANVYRLLSDVSGLNAVVDDCAGKKKVDIKLKNVPVSVAIESLNAKLQTYSRLKDNTLLVGCGPKPADPRLDRRLTLDVKDAALPGVLKVLADAAGVQVRALDSVDGTLTLTLKNVRLETLLAAVRESTGLAELSLEDDALVARARPAR